MKENQSSRGQVPGSGHLSHQRPWTMLRIFQWLGIALGALHGVLYFTVPDYAQYLNKITVPVLAVPGMFFIGYWWPLLLFFAFAPRRFHEEPETQAFLRNTGLICCLHVNGLLLRILSLFLLWPFSVANFFVLYRGLFDS